MKSDIQNMFHDFLSFLIEEAKEARDRRKGIGVAASKDPAFDEGRALAYYEVLSTFINMGMTFGLSSDEFPGLKFDCDKELLN